MKVTRVGPPAWQTDGGNQKALLTLILEEETEGLFVDDVTPPDED